MSSNNRNRGWGGGVGMATGVAFAAALIGLANAPAASADSEVDLLPDPLQELFGNTGLNSWTIAADSSLISSDPTLAASLDASVDNFESGFNGFTGFGFIPTDPFSVLATYLDPTAFSEPPAAGGLPTDLLGDLAVVLDYSVFSTGLAPELDPVIGGLLLPVELPLFLLLLSGM